MVVDKTKKMSFIAILESQVSPVKKSERLPQTPSKLPRTVGEREKNELRLRIESTEEQANISDIFPP